MLNTHPVHDVVLVAEGDALEQHQHVALDLRFRQRPITVPDHLRIQRLDSTRNVCVQVVLSTSFCSAEKKN